jgi:hypothetical protein
MAELAVEAQKINEASIKDDNQGAGLNRLKTNFKNLGLAVPRGLGWIEDPNDPRQRSISMPTAAEEAAARSARSQAIEDYRNSQLNGPQFGPEDIPDAPGSQSRSKGNRPKSTQANTGEGIDVLGKGRAFVTGLGSAASDQIDRITAQAAAEEELFLAKEQTRMEAFDREQEAHERRLQTARETSELENANISAIFGTPAELDAQTQAIQMMSASFDVLANAFVGAVDMLITGSGSAAEAFNKFVGEGLRAMSVDMAIRALRETGAGFAALASVNPVIAAKAPGHFIAAAKYGAGAVAAGVGARMLGAGGASAPSAGSGAPPATTGAAGIGTASGGTGGNESGGSSQVFIVGESFTGRSAREREAEFREISRRSGFRVEGDVVIDG